MHTPKAPVRAASPGRDPDPATPATPLPRRIARSPFATEAARKRYSDECIAQLQTSVGRHLHTTLEKNSSLKSSRRWCTAGAFVVGMLSAAIMYIAKQNTHEAAASNSVRLLQWQGACVCVCVCVCVCFCVLRGLGAGWVGCPLVSYLMMTHRLPGQPARGRDGPVWQHTTARRV